MSSTFQIESINSGYRSIISGKEYDRYFPKPEAQDRIIIQDGEVSDTVELMKKVVWRYIDDTKRIAPVLKGKSLQETAEHIWNFLFRHIQYKLDQRGLEQLRRPARSWAERNSGIDCDCFSIFISSILTNLQIPHSFRITKYGGTHFQHVYVVVPSEGNLWIIDPVLSRFNYEKPFSEHKDFPMNLQGIDVAVLSGHSTDEHNGILFGSPDFDSLGEAGEQEQLDAMYQYLVSTRNTIAASPHAISHIEDPKAFIKMMDYAISHWYSDKRDEALEVLAQNEEQLNLKNGFAGFQNEDDWEDGYLGASKRGFFKRVGDFAKRTGNGIQTSAKNVGKAIVRFNPLSVAARLGFLAALKINLKNMASKLKWAYATQQQAAQNGISAEQWQGAKQALVKIERLFADKLQGKRSALREAILQGRAGGLNGKFDPSTSGLSGLGEPISLGASIAAATPLIVAAVKILNDAGLFAPNENTSTDNLQAEVQAAQRSNGIPFLMNIASNSSPAMQANPQNMPTASAQTTPGQPIPSPSGLMAFVKKNPTTIAVGAGAVVIAVYALFKGKKKTRKPSLSGPRKARSTTRRPTTKRRTIKKVNLK